MRKVRLTRIEHSDQGTFGVLSFEGRQLFTLECPWRDNQPMISCIPTGRYEVVWAMSPRFKRNTCRLVGVPGRGGVLIHSANYAGDPAMGWISQLNGCIAPAKELGRLKNRNGMWQQAGLLSAPATREFDAWADKKPFTLEIV